MHFTDAPRIRSSRLRRRRTIFDPLSTSIALHQPPPLSLSFIFSPLLRPCSFLAICTLCPLENSGRSNYRSFEQLDCHKRERGTPTRCDFFNVITKGRIRFSESCPFHDEDIRCVSNIQEESFS